MGKIVGKQPAGSLAFLLPPGHQLSPSLPSSFLASHPASQHQVVLGLRHIGVIRTKACGIDLQGSPVIVFHLLSFALVLAQQSQVAELLGHIWMKLAQDLVRVSGWVQSCPESAVCPHSWPCLFLPFPGSPMLSCTVAQPLCTCPVCHTEQPDC